MGTGRIQARGQVTVPREIREAVGIGPGTDLYFIPLGPGRFEARALPPRQSIADLVRTFAMPGPAPDLAALREEFGAMLAEPYTGEERS
jgi:bifunctional DNA-binding transcriptional regulator/antitoxin component of YhaV-PrlF toxin-antitoxin module